MLTNTCFYRNGSSMHTSSLSRLDLGTVELRSKLLHFFARLAVKTTNQRNYVAYSKEPNYLCHLCFSLPKSAAIFFLQPSELMLQLGYLGNYNKITWSKNHVQRTWTLAADRSSFSCSQRSRSCCTSCWRWTWRAASCTTSASVCLARFNSRANSVYVKTIVTKLQIKHNVCVTEPAVLPHEAAAVYSPQEQLASPLRGVPSTRYWCIQKMISALRGKRRHEQYE